MFIIFDVVCQLLRFHGESNQGNQNLDPKPRGNIKKWVRKRWKGKEQKDVGD